VFLTYTVIIILHGLINTFGVRLLAMINNISAWWHMGGVLVIVVVLIAIPDHHKSLSFVFTDTENFSGFQGHGFSNPVFWFVFGLGLLMSQYTITGYDASAHMSEETRNASRAAAYGVIMSVVVSLIFGWIILLAVTFAVPGDIGKVTTGGDLGAAFMVQYIWQTATSSKWAEFMLFIAVVAQLFCGMASVTSASRMLFAFSRDGATPFHATWRRLGSQRQPVYSVWCICTLSFLLMVPTWWKPTIGYLVGTSIAIIGLYIAYVIPVFLRWRIGDAFEPGAWSLGRHYKWIDPIAVLWVAFITILFILPVTPGGIPGNENFSWDVVNYAPLTVGGALILFGGWWVLSARNWFRGPIRQGDESDLEAIEAQLGPAGAD
jgi:amino acid transporter